MRRRRLRVSARDVVSLGWSNASDSTPVPIPIGSQPPYFINPHATPKTPPHPRRIPSLTPPIATQAVDSSFLHRGAPAHPSPKLFVKSLPGPYRHSFAPQTERSSAVHVSPSVCGLRMFAGGGRRWEAAISCVERACGPLVALSPASRDGKRPRSSGVTHKNVRAERSRLVVGSSWSSASCD